MQKIVKTFSKYHSCNYDFTRIFRNHYSIDASRPLQTTDNSSDTSSTENDKKQLHIPVMLNEVIKSLVEDANQFDSSTTSNKIYLDMTFGAGGHTKELLNKSPSSTVYALDRDPFAKDLAQKLSLEYNGRIIPLLGKFSDLDKVLQEKKFLLNCFDGALIDCGVSSMQFDTPERGFMVSKDGPLDMRMSSSAENDSVTAADVVNKLDEKSLARLISKYGEERMAEKIAHGICYFRSAHGPIMTTKQLADIIGTTMNEFYRGDSLNRPSHMATKTFQAIRIFVNNELNELYNGISNVYKYLKPGGRLAVISFHSLEDRIVKSHFHDVDLDLYFENEPNEEENLRKQKKSSKLRQVDQRKKFKLNKVNTDLEDFKTLVKTLWTPLNNRKVVVPTKEEIEMNPRSRSAKLRVAIKN